MLCISYAALNMPRHSSLENHINQVIVSIIQESGRFSVGSLAQSLCQGCNQGGVSINWESKLQEE